MRYSRSIPRTARRLRTLEALEGRVLLSAYAGQQQVAEGAVLVRWDGVEALARPDEYIVRLDGLSGDAADQVAAAGARLEAEGAAVRVEEYLGRDGLFRVNAAPGTAPEAVSDRMAGVDGLVYLEPNYILTGQGEPIVPDDPLFPLLSGLDNTGQTILGVPGTPDADIDAPEAWSITTGDFSVVVGVIDSGIDYTHPDLYLNVAIHQGEIPAALRAAVIDLDGDGLVSFRDLNAPSNSAFVADLNGNGIIDAGDLLADSRWADGLDTSGNGYVDDLFGWDFFANDNNPFDEHGHGTHVSGTIGAGGDDGVGVVGVSWDVQIQPLRFLGPTNTGPTSAALSAINYATMMRQSGVNLRVTNNSWGGGGFSTALRDAIAASGEADILFVAAAGNNNSNNDLLPVYPASYGLENMITVASTTNQDVRSGFSNFGANSVDLAAPGTAILSTLPAFVTPSRYGFFNGTSMATPHVSGVAALVASIAPGADAALIKEVILAGVDPLDSLQGVVATGGRLNAFSTLQLLQDNSDEIRDLPPFQGVEPLGSLVYETTTTGFLSPIVPDAADRYGLTVDPGQTLTIEVAATGGLQPIVELAMADAQGNLQLVASAEASDGVALIQAEPVGGTLNSPGRNAPSARSYVVTVRGANDGGGRYDLRVLLNAALEGEGRGGVSNDAIDAAQSLDPAFVSMLGGYDDPVSARPARAAVLGRIDAGAQATVPSSLADAEGDAGNAWPFHIGAFGQPSMRYQQIYSASEFAGGGLIDEIRFRRNLGASPFSNVVFDARISLGYAATTVATASPVFAQNIGEGFVTVFDGQMTLSSLGNGSPNPFDIILDVAALFDYDPSKGDLLLDIELRNSPFSAFIDASGAAQQSSTTRIYSFPGDVDAEVGIVGVTAAAPQPYGLVTQFGFVPDTDLHSVTLRAGQSLTLAVEALSAGSARLELLDADGTVLAQGRSFRQQNELIVNGSFETGDFTGWTVQTTGSPFQPWSVSGPGFGGGFDMETTQPQDGSFVAWNGFDGGGPMEFTMFQDVSIPADTSPTLSWTDRIQWNFTLGGPATLPRTREVLIVDPGTNEVLQQVSFFSTGTQSENPTGDTGWQSHSADLSAFAGSTVRLLFREIIPQSGTGPGQAEFDAISIDLGLNEPIPTNVDDLIQFVAPASGTYFVRVSGTADTAYNLVATRGLTFDLEGNDELAAAQPVLSPQAAGRHWVLGHVGVAGQGIESTITFDELPFQSANGVSLAGVTFGYTIDGVSSDRALFNALGPGTTTYTNDPSLVGLTIGVLSLEFDEPVTSLEFGLALSTTISTPNGATVSLFDADNSLIGTFQVAVSPQTFFFTSGLFRYEGAPVARAEIAPNASVAGSFVLDNLSFASPSDPDLDVYVVEADGNRMLDIDLLLPAWGPGAFENGLIPVVRLYDPSGNLVAEAEGTASNRQVSLKYKVPKQGGGRYSIAVEALGDTVGEYVLSINGASSPGGTTPGKAPAGPGRGQGQGQGRVAVAVAMAALTPDAPAVPPAILGGPSRSPRPVAADTAPGAGRAPVDRGWPIDTGPAPASPATLPPVQGSDDRGESPGSPADGALIDLALETLDRSGLVPSLRRPARVGS
ncbi:S8 family serine peptidase [Tautonia sp. JC769]|uniref:S8 family serine peptidase n=1 Tax=Tautonia sp. JC769 TaxID=3232135 RepID=UPI003458B875